MVQIPYHKKGNKTKRKQLSQKHKSVSLYSKIAEPTCQSKEKISDRALTKMLHSAN